ncbi:nuclear transport factor 2 family protein [Persicobacter psychrovividus]|uniref:SnoaL-like domain-containing protein n=1 Tax=Persicobacter psychrovividus TaxID=387638 RepID=A0ABM7VLC2_9BACT|nr:hypothetical protein PEPS_40540 [Persicobacter psychrovividus]
MIDLLNNKESIVNFINRFFVAVDDRNWPIVQRQFAPEVVLDYSSMGAGPAGTVRPEEIITEWKKLLPGFDNTHHQVGNHVIEHSQNNTTVVCYATASHYLYNDSGDHIWRVVGTYNFEIAPNEHNKWRIHLLRFNLKFTEGNELLPEIAKKKIKESTVS